MKDAGKSLTFEFMSETQALRIEESKIVDYLLNPNHPVGRAKAKFFVVRVFRPRHKKLQIRSAVSRQDKQGFNKTTQFLWYKIRD